MLSLYERIKHRALYVYDAITDIVFTLMLIIIMTGIVIGTFRLFLSLGALLKYEGITGGYLYIISDLLTLFMLIELSRSLAEYFRNHRLRMKYVVEVGFVFVLRHVMIKVFEHEVTTEELYSLSAVMFVLGLVRVSLSFAPGESRSSSRFVPSRSTKSENE